MNASRSDQETGLGPLARLAQGGNGEALGELARRASPLLLDYLRRRCRSMQDAEDLRQETLLRMHQNLDSYDAGRPFEPWLLTIAARLAAGRARNDERRSAQPLPVELADNRAGVAEDAAEREAGVALWKQAARALPHGQYRALWLRYVERMDVRQVAAAMKVSEANVKVMLFRARQRLMAVPQVRGLLDRPADSQSCNSASAQENGDAVR